MDIGERLRELRQAQQLSQGDMEERSGLLRCYISRVECGYTTPSLETLEKIARALDLELYQLFYRGEGKPTAAKIPPQNPLSTWERHLVELFRRLSPADQMLLLGLAQYSARKWRPPADGERPRGPM